MEKNISKEKMKSYMEEYKEKHGMGGLLGIIAEMYEERIDKNDLEQYKLDVEREKKATFIPHEYLEQFRTPSSSAAPVMEASIYAEEHIPAVQEDLKEQSVINDKNGNKAKVLVPGNNHTPNPWGDAEVVLPGQLKLK